jgi:hypothetical protein
MGQIGRNDPCPCGSGKKYKRCCLERKGALPAAEIQGAGAFTPEARASAIQKLLKFASGPEFDTDRDIAASLFWGCLLEDRTDEEIRMVEELPQTEINFNTWFLCDMDLEDEQTAGDQGAGRPGDRDSRSHPRRVSSAAHQKVPGRPLPKMARRSTSRPLAPHPAPRRDAQNLPAQGDRTSQADGKHGGPCCRAWKNAV